MQLLIRILRGVLVVGVVLLWCFVAFLGMFLVWVEITAPGFVTLEASFVPVVLGVLAVLLGWLRDWVGGLY